jgi:hypothetical protein
VRIVPFTADREGDWRQFVEAHPDRSIGHLPAIATLERLTSGATDRSLMVLDDADRLVGIVPLFEVERRELRAFRTRILCSGTHLPSGPLFAPSMSRKQLQQLTGQVADRLVEDGRRLDVDAIAIAYPTVVKARPAVESLGLYPLRPFGFRESNVVALVVDLSQPVDALLAGMDGGCRNRIKRCRTAGAEVRAITSRDEWLACDELNRATLGAHAFSTEALSAIWDLFVAPRHAAVLGAFFEGRLASVVMVTLVGASSYYWVSFNVAPPPVPGTNSLALWEGMLAAKAAGATTFELGSLEFDDPKQVRIGKFKTQFGGRPVYTLAGARQMRPVRRGMLDLAGHLVRSMRRPGPQKEPTAPEAPVSAADSAP